MSVSRGLQVEEDDLIQFSDGQPVKKSPKTGSKSDQLDELNEGEEEEDLVRECLLNNWVGRSTVSSHEGCRLGYALYIFEPS